MQISRLLILLFTFIIFGCDRGSRLYTDSVTDQFGNAVATNIATQTADPWPKKSKNKNIVTDVVKNVGDRVTPSQDSIGGGSGQSSGGSGSSN